MRIGLGLTVLLFVAILSFGVIDVCIAEELNVDDESAQNEPTLLNERASSNKINSATIDTHFAAIRRSIAEEQYGVVSERLKALLADGEKLGYKNFPGFSEELLRASENVYARGKATEALFLVKKAATLSPQDAVIQLTAATYTNVLSYSESFEYFISGLISIWNQPLALLNLGHNILLFGLIGATLTLMIVIVMQLIFGFGHIYMALGGFYSEQYRVIGGVVSMLALLILPIFAGLFVALSVWSIAIGYALKQSRWLPTFLGVVLLSWGFSTPILQVMQVRLSSPTTKAVEQVSLGFYRTGNRDNLFRQAGLKQDNHFLFAKAKFYHHEFELEKSRAMYRELLKDSRLSSNLARAAQFNVGILEEQAGNTEAAKSAYLRAEQLGENGVEINQALARVHLALLDMEGHRAYFSKVKELVNDPHANSHEVSLNSLLTPSAMSSLGSYIKAPASESSESQEGLNGRRNEFLKSFFPGYPVQSLFIVAALLLVFGLVLSSNRFHPRFSRRELRQLDFPTRPSRIWALVPGGMLILGKAPNAGCAILAFVLSVCMFAFDVPVNGVALHYSQYNYFIFFISIACVMYFSVSFYSLRKHRAQVEDGGYY